jgi:hypothetical protein
MGQEATCVGRYKGEQSEGAARLEHKDLTFRGDFRLRIPFAHMESVEAVRGELRIRFGGETAAFVLGPVAEDWARRFLHPPSRADKLGIKPGMTVRVHALDDGELLRELESRNATLLSNSSAGRCDLVFVGADSRVGLNRLRTAMRDLKPAGALWVVRPKGRREITESDVMAAGKAAGLVDVKVVSFSDTHTAEKFVIPVATRAPRSRSGPARTSQASRRSRR